MNLQQFLASPDEKPLDKMVANGGFCSIFRTIGCVGDSLSSGEFQGNDEQGRWTYHDMYEHSWGQYLARAAGCKVYNFSRGGMTAQEYCETFADQNGYFDADKVCQAYIIALGVNDINHLERAPFGSLEDICLTDWHQNKKTFVGYYAQIIARLKENQPDAKFFLMTLLQEPSLSAEKQALYREHRDVLYALAEMFDNLYVLDMWQYGPTVDDAYKRNFYLSGHLTPSGYVLTAEMVMSYIDYIVRHAPRDFARVGFIGTPYQNTLDI